MTAAMPQFTGLLGRDEFNARKREAEARDDETGGFHLVEAVGIEGEYHVCAVEGLSLRLL